MAFGTVIGDASILRQALGKDGEGFPKVFGVCCIQIEPGKGANGEGNVYKG
jgi:hypothetical protein